MGKAVSLPLVGPEPLAQGRRPADNGRRLKQDS